MVKRQKGHPFKGGDAPIKDTFAEHCKELQGSIERSQTTQFLTTEKTMMLRFARVLVGTAIGSSTLSFIIDQFTYVFGLVREKMTTSGSESALATVVCFNIALATIARLVVRTTLEAEGSGFPELKAMLFGKL